MGCWLGLGTAKFYPNNPYNPKCPNYPNNPNSLGIFQTKASLRLMAKYLHIHIPDLKLKII